MGIFELVVVFYSINAGNSFLETIGLLILADIVFYGVIFVYLLASKKC